MSALDESQYLSGALQENILTLLCFDDASAGIVRNAVVPQLFESKVYREIASHAINFYDQYGEAIKEHLPDHLEAILEGDDRRKAEHYSKVLHNLHSAKDAINSEYVISQLQKFVRLQRFKSGLLDAVTAIKDNDDIDRAESIMNEAMKSQAVSFDGGSRLDNARDIVDVLEHPEEEGFTLGIPEFDRVGIMPRRKELFGFVAPRGRGKSWWLIHLAKRALMQRWSVLVITLEMSERAYRTRLLQSFFAISKREAEVKVTKFRQDSSGHLDGFSSELLKRETMRDPDIKDVLLRKAKREFSRRPPMIVKGWPTGSLTMPMLEAYIDGLERHEGVSPDLIVVDYPRLFNLNTERLRLELGAVNIGLRGLAGKRNCAVAIVAQGNRASESAPLVRMDMVEEDISFGATCDVVMTYSRTLEEERLGLARLLADKVRNESAKQLVLLSQAYAIGQFCLDSALMRGDDYNRLLKESREMDERRGERRRAD